MSHSSEPRDAERLAGEILQTVLENHPDLPSKLEALHERTRGDRVFFGYLMTALAMSHTKTAAYVSAFTEDDFDQLLATFIRVAQAP